MKAPGGRFAGFAWLLGAMLAAPAITCAAKAQKRQTTMSSSGEQVTTLVLHAFPLPLQGSAGVDHLEMIEHRGAPALVTSASNPAGHPSVLALYRIGGVAPGARASAPPVATAAPLAAAATFTLPASMSVPQWTVTVEPGTGGAARAGGPPTLDAVLTQPGSARCPLVSWRAGAADTAPITPQGMRVFSAPRFVRRHAAAGPGPGPVVALESREDDDAIILLAPPAPVGPGGWHERVLLEPAGGRAQAAVVVCAHDGYLLVFKTPWAGGGGGASDRLRPPFGSVQLGVVQVQRFDRGWAAVGQPIALPGAEPVYELDADVDGDRLVVLGTTRAGYEIIVARTGASDRLIVVARGASRLPTPATAPALVTVGDGAAYALLQHGHDRTASVLLGHF